MRMLDNSYDHTKVFALSLLLAFSSFVIIQGADSDLYWLRTLVWCFLLSWPFSYILESMTILVSRFQKSPSYWLNTINIKQLYILFTYGVLALFYILIPIIALLTIGSKFVSWLFNM